MALKMLYPEFVDKLPSLEGKSVAITGTTSGTGFHAARATIKKGAAALFLLNRKSERSDAGLKSLETYKEELESKTELFQVDCDFSKISNVEKAAKELNEQCEKFGGLNVLANNAGIMAFPDDRTEDGYDVQMQINHLGQYLLTRLILPSLKAKSDSKEEVRIVQHSSEARNMGKGLKGKYYRKCKEKTLGGHGVSASFSRYSQTKLSNSCFALALAKKLEEKDEIDTSLFKSVVAEPGLSNTDLLGNLLSSHKSKGTLHNYKIKATASVLTFFMKMTMKTQSAEDGSMCLLQAMFGEEVENGDFFIPEQKQVGLPFKEITKCKAVEKTISKEKNTLSEENQEVVWKCSNEEMGDFFEYF